MRPAWWMIPGCFMLFATGCGGSPERPNSGLARPAAVQSSSVARTPSQPKDEAPRQKLSEDAKEAFSQAVAFYKHQLQSGQADYSLLLEKYEQVLRHDPNMAEAHYNMGVILEMLHRDEQAAQHYKKALEARPDLTLAAANWGALLARHGKLDMALLVYQRALKKDEKNSAVLLNMAAIYEQQKKYAQALKMASGVLVRDPRNAGAYRIMASVYYDKGDLDMAHLICLKGLQVKSEDPRLLNTLGLVFLGLKKVPEALVQFRLALKQEPNMITTRSNIAKVALDYKDFRVAKQEFKRILGFDPNNQEASVGLGIAMRGLGEFELAKTHFERLAKKHPQDPAPHYWLGELALKNLSDTKIADREYRRFIELSGSRLAPEHPVHKRLKQVQQNFAMERKMREMQSKMEQEERKRQERERELAVYRKKILDQAWEKATQEGGVVPPAKLEGDKLPFVLIPPAVLPSVSSKVRLVGMKFKLVKSVHIGTIKAKWRKIDTITLEMTVPKGLGLGSWDVMVSFKDDSEEQIVFQGGLWVGEETKQKEKPDSKGKRKNIKNGNKKKKPKLNKRPRQNKNMRGGS